VKKKSFIVSGESSRSDDESDEFVSLLELQSRSVTLPAEVISAAAEALLS
jgi:hypothetical protein